MAITKTGIREQLREHLAQNAPDGETVLACAQGQTGPSPLLTNLVMNVPPLVALLEGLRRYYLLAVTETTLVIYRSNRATNRPGDLEAAIPLTANPVTELKKGKVWSRVYVQHPDRDKPTRYYVSPTWNSELTAFPQQSSED